MGQHIDHRFLVALLSGERKGRLRQPLPNATPPEISANIGAQDGHMIHGRGIGCKGLDNLKPNDAPGYLGDECLATGSQAL